VIGHVKTVYDRDLNAALNLKELAVSFTVTACGAEGAGSGHTTRTEPTATK
jgi:putative transposase